MTNEEPVLTASSVVAAVSAVMAVLVAFEIVSLTGEQQELLIAATIAVLGVVGPIVGGIWARSKTTPLVEPKDEDGQPLVRPDGSLPISKMRNFLRKD